VRPHRRTDLVTSPSGSSAAGGIVRQARRPAGWTPPGATPRPPHDRPELWPRAGEDLCYLAGEWRILQKLDGHRWSLDDLVTAWFAAELCGDVPPRRIADLGCGIGTVLLLLAWRFAAARVVGVEAQDVSVDLARRSIAWNGVEARCDVRHGDLRDARVLAGESAFDLVTATPPYLAVGTAVASERPQRGPCRVELRGGIEAYCEAAARFVGDSGRFVTCAGGGHLGRVEAAVARAGLAIERRLDVVPRAGKPALFSVYAICQRANQRRSGVDRNDAAASLIVRDAAGARTEQFQALRRSMGMP